MKKKILIIEDSKAMAQTIAAYIDNGQYNINFAYTGAEGMAAFEEFKPDAVLLDIRLPDMTGLDILKKLRERDWRGGVLIITGETSINTAVEAMQIGADDFVAKPLNPERLNISLKNVLEKKQLENIAQAYQKIAKTNFESFIGASPEMQTVYQILENAALSNAPVFITGESGTGKELAALAVHNLSKRSDRQMAVINCAAIPHNLLESEIFGHVKGAFTGATDTRIGIAERAHMSTLFLDELGEMPIDLQPKLLRFIQTGKFTPVGGSKEIEVNVRFISATNINPLDNIQTGNLREDLYYRLNVIPVHMPPLRQRGEDVCTLADFFLQKYASEEGREFRSISSDAQDLMLSHSWQGNVRELENVIRQAVVMNRGEIITFDMLASILARSNAGAANDKALAKGDNLINFTPSFVGAEDIRPMEEYERLIIERAIHVCGGNLSEAARCLKINPSTIYRKQQKWIE